MRQRGKHLWMPYVLASVSVTAILTIRWALLPVLGDRSIFLSMLPAVILSAWYGGLGSGLVSSGLGALGVSYLFLQPRGSLLILRTVDLIGFTFYFIVGGLISWLSDLLHRSANRLEEEVQKGTSELRDANAQLEVSERKYRDIVDLLPHTVYIQQEGKIVLINPSGLRLLGATKADQIIGKNVLEIIHPDYHDLVKERIRKLREEGIPAGMIEEKLVRLDGSVVDVEIAAVPFMLNGKPAAQVLAHDISARKQSQEAVRESEVKYRSIVHNAVYGIYHCSIDGRFLDVNPALVKMLGYESADEVLELSLDTEVYADPGERVRTIEQHRHSDRIDGMEVEWRRKDGTPITVRLSGQVVRDQTGTLEGFRVFVENVSERRSLEAQLQQAQKMEAFGRLAGAIAHDFNNLLTAIIGYSDFALYTLDKDQPIYEDLQAIKQSGERAAALTRQLLAFSRSQMLAPRVLDLNSVVAGIEKMLRRLIGEEINLVTILNPDLGRVKADPGQLEQVIMNLAVNARDAMPNGGKLIIETENVELDEDYVRGHLNAKPGRYAMMAMSDTGCGMDTRTRSRIFEPFFTTKEQGKGTGLGLSTVYGIVKQSGGDIWVNSDVGKGTTFKIYLPLLEDYSEAADPGIIPATSLHGSETVLVVEDAAALRCLVCKILGRYGYKVAEARDVQEAIDICTHPDTPIHIMLSDVIMPHMRGPELAKRLEQLRPGLKVLFMSGYTDDGVAQNGILECGAAFLQKPFTPVDLVRKIREVLDRCSANQPRDSLIAH